MKIVLISILILIIPHTVTYGDSHELDILIRVGYEVYEDYKVTGNKIEFIRAYYDSTLNKKILSQYSRKLSTEEIISLIKFIGKCDLGKLERSYSDHETLDGYSVNYEIKFKGAEYRIDTYNIYHPTMISICEKINELLPNEYHMHIPSKTAPGMIVVDQNKDTEQRH